MKPEQFIREQGLDAVKDCIEEAKAYGGLYVNAKTLELSKHIPSYDAVSIIELMRLVESVDLVESWGGIEDLKLYDLSHCKDKPESAGYKLLQAIADYESIYGGGDEIN
ncbi:TPA: hypothetical protein PKT77_003496 [Acinetobacter baumannii]|uniref:hypothetical protein n=1 Tax=Acinetobacter baumannii TaxID=470 RepID=UPI00070793C8|nr:hypothetical protein [Acinetobacter baumannii]KAB1101817.1 hypothetical protein F6W73_02835 [Acinetobacter baumannii]KQE41368.1 hypothetical protein APD45_12080 [Acinetobacter baumannii]KQE48236.1 hypothetical protein APD45_05735 [Acinetobacter baumannii]MBP4676458.1 hypothetical protein [Acinetobacter baumannii]MCA4384362.1 hypothetical protein [Acinetobacter baumannii]